jgi:hypothetical protein
MILDIIFKNYIQDTDSQFRFRVRGEWRNSITGLRIDFLQGLNQKAQDKTISDTSEPFLISAGGEAWNFRMLLRSIGLPIMHDVPVHRYRIPEVTCSKVRVFCSETFIHEASDVERF